MTPELLSAVAANYSLHKSMWLPAAEVARVADPFLGEFQLRYRGFGRYEPLPLVLAFAEKLAARP